MLTWLRHAAEMVSEMLDEESVSLESDTSDEDNPDYHKMITAFPQFTGEQASRVPKQGKNQKAAPYCQPSCWVAKATTQRTKQARVKSISDHEVNN